MYYITVVNKICSYKKRKSTLYTQTHGLLFHVITQRISPQVFNL